MANPYIYDIKQNSPDSHQTTPAPLLTVVRWANRDTKNYSDSDSLDVRQPLVIYNDVIHVSTSNTKQGLTPQLAAVLKGGDINYSTAIKPGDFVFCNMVSDSSKISKGTRGDNTLRNRAAGLRPINKWEDGFKGIFKVQNCRRRLMVDPNSGAKSMFYQLTAYGFTEFNNTIYYNPVVYNNFKGKFALFLQQFNNFWTTFQKKRFSIDKIMKALIQSLIGRGTKQKDNKIPPPNQHFRVPKGVGDLLGVSSAYYACDIYNYIFGIWRSSSSSNNPNSGFNPSISEDSEYGRGFYKTGTELDGYKIFLPEFWNNVKAWSIINSYLNPVINEIYTTYRVNPEGSVMPTLIARQKPFTSLHYKPKNGESISKYLEMPRWRIDPNLIYGYDLSTDEAARINFVQIFTRSIAWKDALNWAAQTGQGNYQVDIDDVVRSGLRPYVATADFDYPIDKNKQLKGPRWSNLVSDWLFAGHLREGGTISCYGIEEPISVGDNLEFDGVTYHIESINHSIATNTEGVKQFRTQLGFSFGTDNRSSIAGPVYSEMDHTDYKTKAIEDWDHNKLMPGWSEVQDIVGRGVDGDIHGEETSRYETKQKSFTDRALIKPRKKKK